MDSYTVSMKYEICSCLGEEWRSTVIGCLLSTQDEEPINIQNIDDQTQLEDKITEILQRIEAAIGKPRKRILLSNNIRTKSLDASLLKKSSSTTSSKWTTMVDIIRNHKECEGVLYLFDEYTFSFSFRYWP